MKKSKLICILWLALIAGAFGQSATMLPQPSRLFRSGATPTSDDKAWLRALIGLDVANSPTFSVVTADSFVGPVTGNASTATTLQTGRTINGVTFTGGANITVPAAAGTVTGTTLAANVVTSSLTTVGPLIDLTVTNPISGSITGNAATASSATLATTATTANAVAVGSVTSAGILDGTIVAGDIANGTITAAKMVADPFARANHTGSQTLSTISDAGSLAALSSVDSAHITDGAIVNADVNASAAIAQSKIQSSIDLWCLGGQSNAGGKGGDTSQAPTPVAGAYQYTTATGVAPMALTAWTSGTDGLGTSLAPAFANTYVALTGRNVGFVVGAAVDGASIVTTADVGNGNFGPTGTLRALMVTRYLAAKTAFEAAGWKVNLKGIIWVQGEAEAASIQAATSTQADYEAALPVMVTYYRTNLGADLPFYMVRTGKRTSTSDATGCALIRASQEKYVLSDPKSRIVFWYADKFPDLGYLVSDGSFVHYSQVAQNLIGTQSAQNILGADDNALTYSRGKGNLVDQIPGWQYRATMPAVAFGANSGVDYSITGAGASSQLNRAFNLTYNAGYTGSSASVGIASLNSNAGTGTTLIPAAGSNSPVANAGINGVANGTTSGTNIGTQGLAQGGNVNVGLYGGAQAVKNGASNFGVVGSAINTGTTPVMGGGFFTLNGSVPTISAALSASNGTTTSDIIDIYDNTTNVFKVADGGAVTATGPITAPYIVSDIVTAATPTTGQTVSSGTTKANETLYVTPAGTLTALTIALPAVANARVGQTEDVFISQIIATLTVSVSGSGTLAGGTPDTTAANSTFGYRCVSTSGNGTWILYRSK